MKKHIVKEIKKLKMQIKNSKYTLKQSQDAFDKMKQMLDSGSFDEKKFIELSEALSLSNDMRKLKDYEMTLKTNLMKIQTKYVITDTPQLISPAGFALDTKVFHQTKIAIHTNTPITPDSNVALYLHKV